MSVIAVDPKAKLLLQRERELFELRTLRSRAEEWFKALHAVSPERFDVALEVQARRATEILVGALSFECAAALEYRPDTGEVVFGCAEPKQLPPTLRIERDAAALFERLGGGRYGDGPEPALAPFADALGLSKFFWRWCSSCRGSRFLFVAGSSPRTAQFHTFPDSDREHFGMFTSHAAALLSNSLLVADVRRERGELEVANRGLDASLRELEQTQAQLVASTQMVAIASRQAGMAEIATGILHNVGNVLNSVNVCSEVALERLLGLPLEGVGKVSELLAEQADLGRFFAEDPRGKKTLEYLSRVSERLLDERTGIASELGQLERHLTHIRAIITRQQAYAKRGEAERCDPTQLMEDALIIARNSHHRGSVEVIKEFSPVPSVHVGRHRVLQILVNLITNALLALQEAARPDKRLVAHVSSPTPGSVRLAVSDNGVGIAPEHAARLFQHGFTTRADGHGFGLHNSVLTAQELGGTLRFESAGRGQGATFILELPVESPELAATSSAHPPRHSAPVAAQVDVQDA
jgi:signal transduction histidine kinase